ncbi:MAG: SpoIIE family protein phosphatase [Gemmatimonadaceae bacterium]|nr:SpoIIE family protein phosphatase [Gemmatimonadaceae bacterium]
MRELVAILDRFEDVTGVKAVVWTRSGDRAPIVPEYGEWNEAAPRVLELLAPGAPPAEIETDDGILLAGAVPGPRRAWVSVGPCTGQRSEPAACLEFLLPIVGHFFQSALEVEHAAYELAERYEEINLLYTTSEILGRTVSLEEAAARILEEICETVGARRAAILVHDRVTDTLQVVTALGFEAADAPPIGTQDPHAVSARVFREQRALILEPGEYPCEAESLYRKGGLLSVPILWTNPNPHGAIPLGVVNLSERRTGEPFSAGDEKLVTAIATQIGTAIQNARLVRSSLAQQRLQQEMQLANDLQMKLLPDTRLFAPEALVSARVVPADSVGGDFYHLFRLGDGKIGVMIGDVSSHGYRAALIMALVMSASSIHAQASDDPAVMLNALLATLREELESTEMFISIFYGVLDPRHATMRYANAGHPHAFVMDAAGEVERLAALDPPLGMSAQHPSGRERPWAPGTDVLLLFTDGIADARNRLDVRLGEKRVLDVVKATRTEHPDVIVERVFGALRAHAGEAIRRDDLTLLVART